MKKWYLMIVVAFLGVMITSCSDEPTPTNEIDPNVVLAYKEGGVSKCFKFDSFKIYDRDNLTSNWMLNTDDYLIDLIYNDVIMFTEGKVLTPVQIPMYFGGTIAELRMTWDAYRKITKCKELLYVEIPFSYDESTQKMRINRHEYNVEKMTATELQFNNLCAGELSKFVYHYIQYSMPQEELDRIVKFDSEQEAYLYVVKKAKEEFGEKIDLNKIYSPNIIFDEPIIDLNDLEERILSEEYLY